MEKTAWRSSIIRQFSMKHHTHQHNSIKCNLTACATMWSVQQHFLPLKLWTGFFFIFLWEMGINHSVPLNFSVLKCPFFMKVCLHQLWVILSLSQLLYSTLQSLGIFLSLPANTTCLDCDLGQCMCPCFFCLPVISNVHFSSSDCSSSDPFFPFPDVI